MVTTNTDAAGNVTYTLTVGGVVIATAYYNFTSFGAGVNIPTANEWLAGLPLHS